MKVNLNEVQEKYLKNVLLSDNYYLLEKIKELKPNVPFSLFEDDADEIRELAIDIEIMKLNSDIIDDELRIASSLVDIFFIG